MYIYIYIYIYIYMAAYCLFMYLVFYKTNTTSKYHRFIFWCANGTLPLLSCIICMHWASLLQGSWARGGGLEGAGSAWRSRRNFFWSCAKKIKPKKWAKVAIKPSISKGFGGVRQNRVLKNELGEVGGWEWPLYFDVALGSLLFYYKETNGTLPYLYRY